MNTIDLTYDQDGKLAVETFIADYENNNPSAGEQAAIAAMRLLFGSGKSLPEIAEDAFRCQHVMHAFQGMLVRTADNRKAIRKMFKDYFPKADDERIASTSTE